MDIDRSQKSILIAYATVNGSSKEVAEVIGQILYSKGFEVSVVNTRQLIYCNGYDALVIGTGLYRSMWLPEMIAFDKRIAPAIDDTRIYGWALGIRPLEPRGTDYILNHYPLPSVWVTLNVRDYRIFAGKLILQHLSRHDIDVLRTCYDGSMALADLNGDHRNWSAIIE